MLNLDIKDRQITASLKVLEDQMVQVIPDPDLARAIETIKIRCTNPDCKERKSWGGHVRAGWAFKEEFRCHICGEFTIPKLR